jgi:hypothetical protein
MFYRFIGISVVIASLFLSSFAYAADNKNYVQSDPALNISELSIDSDNEKIFFESTEDLLGENASNVEQLYVMNIDGSNLRQVTHDQE